MKVFENLYVAKQRFCLKRIRREAFTSEDETTKMESN